MELEKQSMKNNETRKILRKTSDKLKTLLTGDSYKSKDEEEAEENEKKKGRENFWKKKKKSLWIWFIFTIN